MTTNHDGSNDDARTSNTTHTKSATDDGSRELEALKKELCGDGSYNYENIVSGLGLMLKHGHILYMERLVVMRRARMPQGEEED